MDFLCNWGEEAFVNRGPCVYNRDGVMDVRELLYLKPR